jgi:hypothetical protein
MEEGLELLEPTELYNMLQQATVFSNLTDPNYMLLMGEYDFFNKFWGSVISRYLLFNEYSMC